MVPGQMSPGQMDTGSMVPQKMTSRTNCWRTFGLNKSLGKGYDEAQSHFVFAVLTIKKICYLCHRFFDSNFVIDDFN